MKNILAVAFIALVTMACSSQKKNATTDQQKPRQGQRGGTPSTADIFKMDANNDGRLSKSEVTGPLQKDFAKIDSNGDGYITKTELENAPKPQRGQRPQKQ